MQCKKHKDVDAPGLCALCLLGERNELRAEVNMLRQRVTDEGVIRGLQEGEQLAWVSISERQEFEAGELGVDKIVVSFENGSQAAMPWAAIISKDGGCIGKYNLANCQAFMPKNQSIKPDPNYVEGFAIGEGT